MTYTTAGENTNPALFMVHGFLSYRGVWQQTMAAFQDSYFCVALDLLGFGDSDKPINGDYSLEAHGQRLLRLADTLGIERFTVIGHSLGGQLAFYAAAALAPARVLRMVSVAGVVTGRLTPLVEHVSHPQIMLGALYPWLYGIWAWSARQPGYAHAFFGPWFHRMDALPFEDWEADRRMAFQPGMHISPFRSVAAGMRRRLARRFRDRVSIGTVHTFQGKEAETVILLLGGNPARPGAFAWAARRPNLLNVAVTRAKHRLYVIGSHERWRRQPYFDELALALPVQYIEAMGRPAALLASIPN